MNVKPVPESPRFLKELEKYPESFQVHAIDKMK